MRLSVVTCQLLLLAAAAAGGDSPFRGASAARFAPYTDSSTTWSWEEQFLPTPPTPEEQKELRKFIDSLPSKSGANATRGAAVGDSSSTSPSDQCADTPVVITPCFVGNQLDYRLVNKPTEHWWCEHNSSWSRMWLPSMMDFPPKVNLCWLSAMVMEHPRTGVYQPTEGVEVRVPDYGSTKALSTLNGNRLSGIWWATIQALQNQGYQDGKDLFGAPMDWRIGPDAYKEPFERLQKLIEKVSHGCGGKRVALLTLSWGGPMTGNFLASRPQAWKDKYIDQFIPINGAFGGSVWPTLSLTSLDPNYNWYYMVPAPIMRSVVSNWGSMNSLVPDPRVYGDRPIVTTMDGKTYGANDFAELLLAANNTIASKTYADTSKYTGTLAPGVRTHCISGYGIPTLSHIQFSDSNFSENKLIQDADGDGTVATESAAVCPGWKNMQKEEVTSDEVKGLFHTDGPKNAVVISHVLRYLGLPYLPEQ